MDRMKKVHAHFENEAAEFDQTILKLIPDYHKMCEILVDFIPYDRMDSFSIIDLGCGTGTLAKVVQGQFPNAQITCVDNSQNMLDLAKHKLNEQGRFIQSDFNDWTFDQSYDLMIRSLALHHLDSDEDKLAFYRKAFRALTARGLLINDDVMTGVTHIFKKNFWLTGKHLC